ncbi:P1 family peptidase [Paracoccus ravus]|uniref:DmpA family aminopeptidase n=1 Tax=Paracoccus ravus TaxID=2447760 RepID=UPI00106EFDC8|nr:P1 family peptidase [Paracoccus ravus]
MSKPRARDLGIPFKGRTGPLNAITDVEGVKVGFTTLTDPSRNMRTGVTAIIPRGDEAGMPTPVWAGQFDLNGNGEMTGTHWINDAGYFIGPICITDTHGVGACHSGATKWMIEHYADFFDKEHAWAMPVVAETYSGVLNDINAMFVEPRHAIEALNAAKDGPVEEGSVGGGNGMISYEYKGGTGTASRVVELAGTSYTVAALVQANHGIRPWLTIAGKELWPEFDDHLLLSKEQGSIIVIIATDAPVTPLQLRQFAKRAAIGIGRAGTPGGNNSGDIFLAFSTANRAECMPQLDAPVLTMTHINNERLDPFYHATVESVNEAVINALVAGEDVPTFKPAGLVVKAIDIEKLREVFADTAETTPMPCRRQM